MLYNKGQIVQLFDFKANCLSSNVTQHNIFNV